MSLIRTPDDRFDELPDFPYEPHYVDVGDARMAYVDVGSGEETFLCLHGVPTWSFLYRKMIPPLSDVGRVVVPDFVGFGRSDKFTDVDEYSFDRFLDQLVTFIEEVDLENITLVAQDWGGILGLCAVDELSSRFARLVLMNFGAYSRLDAIRSGGHDEAETYGLFREWRDYVQATPDLPIADIVDTGPYQIPDPFVSDLDADVRAAYEAPFPGPEYKAGPRAWPQLVPLNLDDPGADRLLTALDETISTWEKPAFVVWAREDPLTRSGQEFFRNVIPTAKDQPEVWIDDAGHFLQEDKGEEIAEHIVDFVNRTTVD